MMKEGDNKCLRGIPNGWKEVDLSHFCTLQRGFDITESNRIPGSVPVYSSSGLAYFHNRALVSPPGVVTGRKGILGKVFFIHEPFWPHDTTLWVKDFRGNHPGYVALVLENFRLERLDAATSVPTLNRNNLAGYLIAIPASRAEQEAIAGALSDADTWVESLEQLIAKKRLIKQGVMQELLTGKRRLPGFQGEWETKRLGNHCRFLRNGTNSRAELHRDGNVKYLHYGDVHSCPSVYLSPISLPALPVEKATFLDRLQDGDLVLADASEDTAGISKSVELINVGVLEVVSGLHTIAVRFDKNLVAIGFAGHLQHCPEFNAHLRRLAAGTKVYATNRRHVASVEMKLPSVAEQTAIAKALDDLAVEIEALEAKLAKARQIKQGMMQELLTGRIRLE